MNKSRASPNTTHNVSLSDFIKISFYRFFKIGPIRRSYWISRSITNWWDYYLLYVGLKKEIILKFRTGEQKKGRHDFFWKDFGDIGGEALVRTKLAKHADLISQKQGFLIVLHSGCQFLVNRLSQAVVLLETFVDEQYKDLQVTNKIVVDVGASIGDSAVYFSKVKKARQVIAFEPYPQTYAIAKTNLEMNNVKNVIMCNEGIGSSAHSVRLDTNYESTVQDDLKPINTGGSEIRISTLHDIIESYRIQNGVLKVDCEGCEYEMILGTSLQDLKCFDEIIIESHHGYANIEEKLRCAGFKVNHSATWYFFNSRTSDHHMLVSLIHGVRS
jgi:FkbM family methyltransferase